MKNLSFKAVLLLALLALFLPVVIYAQSKNTVVTKVGNPTTQGGIGAESVLDWGHKISAVLEPGYDNSYDRMMADISSGSYTAPKSPGESLSNKYWCTFLVIDSFNLAGFSGLSRAHSGVVYMLSFWRTSNDYIFLDYYNSSHKDILEKVKPGYSILFQDNPGLSSIGEFDHAALVEAISINSNGDGSITTLDANLPTIWGKTVQYPVAGWEILGTLKGSSHPSYSVMGFGTKK